MIFQEPMTALDPVYTIGQQIGETVRRHTGIGRAAARARALELLELVRIPSPERRLDAYPHELSGGLRQRAMIAMALSCKPRLLLADEPTTALDATVQVQVLILLRRLQRELGMGMIFVTHDLGVAAEIADRIAVMYAGRIVESGPVAEVLRRAGAPLHRRAARLDRARPGARPRHRGHSRQPARYAASARRAAPSRRAAPGGCRNAATPCRRRAFRRRGGWRPASPCPTRFRRPKAVRRRAGDAKPGSECRAADRPGSVRSAAGSHNTRHRHTAVPAKAGTHLSAAGMLKNGSRLSPGLR